MQFVLKWALLKAFCAQCTFSLFSLLNFFLMMKIKAKVGYCSKTGLKYRGWTDKAIELFLGAPDKEGINPHYRSGPKVKLYLLSRVVAAEGSDSYKQFLAENLSKRESAQKAVETKRAKLFEYVNMCKIHVVVRDFQKVVAEAIEAYNWHKFDVSQHYGHDDYKPATEKSDKEFLDRITVNYLRHNLSQYDDELAELFGKVGTEEAYKILNKRIYSEIAKAYPNLRAECEKQLAKKLGTNTTPEPILLPVQSSSRQMILF